MKTIWSNYLKTNKKRIINSHIKNVIHKYDLSDNTYCINIQDLDLYVIFVIYQNNIYIPEIRKDFIKDNYKMMFYIIYDDDTSTYDIYSNIREIETTEGLIFSHLTWFLYMNKDKVELNDVVKNITTEENYSKLMKFQTLLNEDLVKYSEMIIETEIFEML